jgi:mRNA interferase RelE/StbE
LAWSVSFDPRALAELRKLDRTAQQRVVSYLRERVVGGEDPRALGKALVGGPVQLWRYRVGDYRIICNIEDEKELIHVLRVAHRKDVYR